MEFYPIGLEDLNEPDRFILYRPLAGLAVVGNGALASLAAVLSRGDHPARSYPEAEAFLQAVGFLEPDPPAPPAPAPDFRPTTAVLLLTNQCHLRCVYCYAAAGEQPRQALTPELGYAAIDYVCQAAQALGRPHFDVSFHGGGEPTLAWTVMQACTAYARRQRLPAKITLTTNGIWSARQRDWLVANLDGVSLSMDGDEDTQNRHRPFVSGRESFAYVMRTVADLDRNGLNYGIRLTATAPWSDFPKDVGFICGETGCKSMQVEPAFNTTRGGHDGITETEARAFAAAFLEAQTVARRAGRQLNYSGARLGVASATFCTAPFQALIVNGEGDLTTCYEVSDRRHPLAAISTIGRIEAGAVQIDLAARERLHTRMAQRRAACRSCFCYWSCAGDCYTRTFGNAADAHLQFGPRCQINRAITRGQLLNGLAESGGVWHAPRAGNCMVVQRGPVDAITI